MDGERDTVLVNVLLTVGNDELDTDNEAVRDALLLSDFDGVRGKEYVLVTDGPDRDLVSVAVFERSFVGDSDDERLRVTLREMDALRDSVSVTECDRVMGLDCVGLCVSVSLYVTEYVYVLESVGGREAVIVCSFERETLADRDGVGDGESLYVKEYEYVRESVGACDAVAEREPERVRAAVSEGLKDGLSDVVRSGVGLKVVDLDHDSEKDDVRDRDTVGVGSIDWVSVADADRDGVGPDFDSVMSVETVLEKVRVGVFDCEREMLCVSEMFSESVCVRAPVGDLVLLLDFDSVEVGMSVSDRPVYDVEREGDREALRDGDGVRVMVMVNSPEGVRTVRVWLNDTVKRMVGVAERL